MNPHRGEVAVTINGVPHVAKLTLGALAELEAALGVGSLVELAERFEAARFSSRDVLAVVIAGLRGGGWQGSQRDLEQADFAGGPMGAAQMAARLLVQAFGPPEGAG